MEIALAFALLALIGTVVGLLVFRRRLASALNVKDLEITRRSEEQASFAVQLAARASELRELNATLEGRQREAIVLSELREQTIKENRELKAELLAKSNEVVGIKVTTARLEALNDASASEKASIADLAREREEESERKLAELLREKETLSRELTELKSHEPIRMIDHDRRVVQLNQLQAMLEEERRRDIEIKEQAEAARLNELKETWARHEADVQENIKLLCQKLGIEYIDGEKFPFAGTPDSAIKICDEFIVFDGKSPDGDDLSNFSTYIRAQAEAVKKYTKHDGVKKDVYLVVPTNAIHAVKDTFLSLGDYRVFVITIDSLGPILMSLQKIEEYEFAEQLSPEDRAEIFTSIGKMAHLIKRRLQVDYFFATESVKILTEAEKLPEDILESARQVEQTSKLNPKIEKRAKRIDMVAIEKDTQKLGAKIGGQEIHLGPELAAINDLPLHAGGE